MRLLPKQEKFYEIFLSQGDCIRRGADLLLKGLRENGPDMGIWAGQIKALEEEGDKLIHQVLDMLNHTFITPLDPEDIHRLAHSLDDVLDAIEEVAHRTAAHGLRPIPPEVIQMAELVHTGSGQLVLALKAIDKDTSAQPFCIEINRLENAADTICRDAVTALFQNEDNGINLLRKKEVLDNLEETMDRLEDVADVLENVAVKNA